MVARIIDCLQASIVATSNTAVADHRNTAERTLMRVGTHLCASGGGIEWYCYWHDIVNGCSCVLSSQSNTFPSRLCPSKMCLRYPVQCHSEIVISYTRLWVSDKHTLTVLETRAEGLGSADT